MIPSVSRGKPVTIACWFSLSRKSNGGSLVYSTLNRFDFKRPSWIRYMMPATKATANPTVPSILSATWSQTVLNTGSSVGTALGNAAAESSDRRARGRMNDPKTWMRCRSSTTRNTSTSAQEKNDMASSKLVNGTWPASVIRVSNAAVWERNPIAVTPIATFDSASDRRKR